MTERYKTTARAFTGSSDKELYHKARAAYNDVVKSNRRMAYVRSRYFKKEKVFLDLFWTHLKQKNRRERRRRIALYACALELIQETRLAPTVFYRNKEQLFRFYGESRDGTYFVVQIRRNVENQKYFMSVFPQ